MNDFGAAIQKLRLTLVGAFSLTSFFSSSKASAQEAKLITVVSTKSFDATMEGIKKGVADAGMIVIAEINNGNILAKKGLSVSAESIFIGNPSLGTDAFLDNPAIGLAIPMRVNVYQDKGITYINYFTLSSQLSFFNGKKLNLIGQETDKKLAAITDVFSK